MAETDKPALADFHYPVLARSLGKRQAPKQAPAAVMPAEPEKAAGKPMEKKTDDLPRL